MLTQRKSLPGHAFHSSILRAYDIRGVYGETLFEADARALGRAFGTTVIRACGKPQPQIMLGYDGRLSTPALRAALVEGLVSTGAAVQEIGLGPTPMLYFSVYHAKADAGLMITGSHNPGHHNGFKMMLGQQSFFGEDIQRLGALALAGDFVEGAGSLVSTPVKEAYLEALLDGFRAKGARPLNIVFDPGNGAAGEIALALAERLPGAHRVINAEIDGNFPNHHPDPTVPENMQQLVAEVQAGGFDLGIAFDGDADRVGAVDKTGRILYGDQLMVLFARDVLMGHPGATIIADVKASQCLFDAIAAAGGTPLMWKTGHSLIKAKMKETGAKLAGEMSGHIFFADRWFGFDDGLYAGVRLANLLAHGKEPPEVLMDALPVVHNTPEIRINTTEERKFALVEEMRARLREEGATMSEVDGIRVQTPDGWWLARASNTQAAVIVRAESASAEGLTRLKQALKEQLTLSGITQEI